MDVEDTYQVYALIWDKFMCEKCSLEALYQNQTGKFDKKVWLPEAAKSARADGWFVPLWTAERGLDLVAYCKECKGAG